MMDVAMLVVTGGRERTADEFAALYDAGAVPADPHPPTASPFCLVEGVTGLIRSRLDCDLPFGLLCTAK